ncbi:MAG: HlyD family efflux transporter periplasmic adaptor subunit [Hyphomonadaceae bacterium]|nr:HlyD family efflux transporter periplasmic adaptor subunit [Hyphomonadaceae bacterium]
MSVEAAPQPKATRISDDPKTEMRWGLGAVLGFFGLFLGWAAFVPMDAAVVAPGVVVVSGNRQTVQHPDGGVISRIEVREGQQVERGQLLLELSDDEVAAQERALADQLISLTMRRSFLRAEAVGVRRYERPAEWATLPEDYRDEAEAEFARYASGRDARIAGYNSSLSNVSRQETLMREELSGMRELADEQLVPLTRIRALERGLAELSGRRAELLAARAAELRQIDARVAEVQPALVRAHQALERSRLRSPANGVVVGLSVHTVGGVLRAGERAMDIVPRDQPLIVEAQVQPRDADDLRIGLDVEVKITAFSGRNLPIVHGSITRISGDRFTDERSGMGYFLAEVQVPPEELRQLEESSGTEQRQLRAGLPAEIVAPTRKRTALQYLVEPLNQALWRSFREI